MGRGIKKISENVIAEDRSLILTKATADPRLLNDNNLQDTFDKLPDNPDDLSYRLVNTEAMPLGMLNADFALKGLLMKVEQGEKDSVSTWSKLDARHTLLMQSITTPLIKDYNITTIKIANQNVTTEKIKDANVTTVKIANQNVTTDKIKDANVTTIKIANQNVTTEKIKDKNVTYIKMADRSVNTNNLFDDAVTTPKIKNENVTVTKLATNSVSTIKIQNDAVVESKIKDGAVTEWKIADQAIHSHNIAVGGVATQNLQNACVITDKINDLAIINAKIANETIVGKNKIVKNSITKDRLDLVLNDMLDRAVLHDGKGNVTGANGSTVIDNLTATGDIYAHRVYNVVYMDIAEGYEPGEILEAGDIVAMCEDGKVRKATSIHDCIVGVVSNEYAQCLGASKEELLCGEKVAVGMIGKIHVKVKGPVRLGQRINISLSDAGVGMANWMNGGHNIGQALESIDCDFDEINTILVQVRPL